MKQKLSIAIKCIASIIILNLLCFFMYISFNVIAVGVGTQSEGYVAYKEENGEIVELYTHYYADGDDTKMAEYTDNGIEVKTSSFRTPVSDGLSAAIDILTVLFSAIILWSMLYSLLWKRGDTDNNLATFGHIEREKYKGLKIGLLADVPFALLYLLLWADKLFGFSPAFSGLYKIANYYMFPLIDLCYKGAETSAEISVLGMLCLLVTLIPIPLVAHIGYYCGNNEISLGDKFVYAKTKEKK